MHQAFLVQFCFLTRSDALLQAQGQLAWAPPANFSIRFDDLASELFVGNVYVRLYLKNPGFPLRAPKAFLEGLLKTYLADVADASQVRVTSLHGPWSRRLTP